MVLTTAQLRPNRRSKSSASATRSWSACARSSGRPPRPKRGSRPRSTRSARTAASSTQMLIDTAASIRASRTASPRPKRGSQPLGERGTGSAGRSRAAARSSPRCLQPCRGWGAGRRRPCWCRPEDALQSVRAAILLGAVLPDMKVEVDTLVADLAELVRVRSEIAAEREALGRDLAALSQESQRMTCSSRSASANRRRPRRRSRSERARAVELARQADNLKDLIGQVEQDIDSAARAARAPPGPPKKSRDRPTKPGGAQGPRPARPRRLLLLPPRAHFRYRSAGSGFANLAPRTASAEPRRACRSPAGPARRSPRHATAGSFMRGRSARTDNS